MDTHLILAETVNALGALAAVAALVYRLSLVPTQKISENWRTKTENKLVQKLPIEGMPGAYEQIVIEGQERKYRRYELVTCPECFGTWLVPALWLPALFALSPYTAIPLTFQIVGGLAILWGTQQRLVNY